MPPLRDRVEDIEDIAEHYIRFYSQKYNKSYKELSKEALSSIKSYEWPGNIRALRHAIERAVILSEGTQFEPEDFSIEKVPEMAGEIESKLVTKTEQDEIVFKSEDLNLEKMELALIERSLKKHRYNISHAAKELGLTRAALYRRMEKYGL